MSNGAFSLLNWTNEGPEGLGRGQGGHGSRVHHHQAQGLSTSVETSISLCLYSTSFTFHPTTLLSSFCTELFLVAKTGVT